MKAITEAFLRNELRDSAPEFYVVPEGQMLSPAAREYLMQRKIRIEKAGSVKGAVRAKTGVKPEHMTHLNGSTLVPKDHPRIVFRGKMDSLVAGCVLMQTMIVPSGKTTLVEDLEDVKHALLGIIRAEVKGLPLNAHTIIGLSHAELREQSHNPQKYFGVEFMKLPDVTMGMEYALLNQFRAQIREAEVCAASAFKEGSRYGRIDIIEELNRLSSTLHIMMCRYLAGHYDSKQA